MPFEYFTSNQMEATNQILDFLDLSKIENEKEILTVRIFSPNGNMAGLTVQLALVE